MKHRLSAGLEGDPLFVVTAELYTVEAVKRRHEARDPEDHHTTEKMPS